VSPYDDGYVCIFSIICNYCTSIATLNFPLYCDGLAFVYVCIAICDTNCYVMLDKLIVSQLVKKFSTVCETQRFVTVFVRAGHLSLS